MAEDTATGIGLSPREVAEMTAAGEVEVIDVRRDYEWEAGRMPRARHVEINRVSDEADRIPRERAVVFVCRSGNRSLTVAQLFREAGWDAHNLDGGLLAWAQAGLPLEPEDGSVADPQPAT